MKTHISAWKKLPRSIADEYYQGENILTLARKHNTNASAIITALRYLRVKMRKQGTTMPWRKSASNKLTQEQISQILYIDANQPEINHSQMGKHFRVSRERIRQICLAASHLTRRQKIVSQVTLKHEERIVRQIRRNQLIRDISNAWKAGMNFEDLSIIMYEEIKSTNVIMSHVCALRKQYGLKMFPYRKKYHWKLMPPGERVKRIRDMAREWNASGDIHQIQNLFGYSSYGSAYNSINILKNKYPGLFESKDIIIDRIIKERTK